MVINKAKRQAKFTNINKKHTFYCRLLTRKSHLAELAGIAFVKYLVDAQHCSLRRQHCHDWPKWCVAAFSRLLCAFWGHPLTDNGQESHKTNQMKFVKCLCHFCNCLRRIKFTIFTPKKFRIHCIFRAHPLFMVAK